jgi:hypothetical protein
MSRLRLGSATLLCAALGFTSTSPLIAQTTVTIPPIDFSGVIYTNYQYRTDSRAKDFNKFDVDRIYLTFRMPAGNRASIRVTTDLFQQQNTPNDAYYAGWALRLKYGYFQYDYLTGKPSDLAAVARIGMLHTVVLDHEEQFWPRWISPTDLERAGMFTAADVGISTLVTLPNRWGEIYAAVTNGPGYTSRELDRFKDPQVRLTLTPLAGSGSKLLTTWAITPWYYKGEVASRFVASAAPPVTNGPVSSGLTRDRWGIFTGIRDPRLTLGAQYAQFHGESEMGLNVPTSPRVVVDSTGRIVSGFAIVKPLALLDTTAFPIGVLARYDRVTPNRSTGAAYHVFIAGLIFDLTRRASVSFDYQEQLSNQLAPTPPLKTFFAHVVANF